VKTFSQRIKSNTVMALSAVMLLVAPCCLSAFAQTKGEPADGTAMNQVNTNNGSTYTNGQFNAAGSVAPAALTTNGTANSSTYTDTKTDLPDINQQAAQNQQIYADRGGTVDQALTQGGPGDTTTFAQQSAENSQIVGDPGASVESTLMNGTNQAQGGGSGYNDLQYWWSNDVVGNLFNNIGQLLAKWFTEWIRGWVVPIVKYLTGALRTFVMNPNIAVNALQGDTSAGQNDDISGYVRQAANINYGIACDLLLLLFILCIWRMWAEQAWRGGVGVMGAVGRLIFTSGLMLAWPTIYAFWIEISNEMIQAIYFNSADQVQMLDVAMADAIQGGLAGGAALVARSIAPLVGGAAIPFVGTLLGGVISAVGLIIFLLFAGVLIAELVYLLILKATQTALLTAQYMFAPIFLVCFAVPDTERIGSGYVQAFIEVSLWTFVWVGMLKIMVILLFSDFNPWGKVVVAIGVLQLMIQVPSFIARASISPMSDFISAGLITGGLLAGGAALSNFAMDKAKQFKGFEFNKKNMAEGSERSVSQALNVPQTAPNALKEMRAVSGGDMPNKPGLNTGATPDGQNLNAGNKPGEQIAGQTPPLKKETPEEKQKREEEERKKAQADQLARSQAAQFHNQTPGQTPTSGPEPKKPAMSFEEMMAGGKGSLAPGAAATAIAATAAAAGLAGAGSGTTAGTTTGTPPTGTSTGTPTGQNPNLAPGQTGTQPQPQPGQKPTLKEEAQNLVNGQPVPGVGGVPLPPPLPGTNNVNPTQNQNPMAQNLNPAAPKPNPDPSTIAPIPVNPFNPMQPGQPTQTTQQQTTQVGQPPLQQAGPQNQTANVPPQQQQQQVPGQQPGQANQSGLSTFQAGMAAYQAQQAALAAQQQQLQQGQQGQQPPGQGPTQVQQGTTTGAPLQPGQTPLTNVIANQAMTPGGVGGAPPPNTLHVNQANQGANAQGLGGQSATINTAGGTPVGPGMQSAALNAAAGAVGAATGAYAGHHPIAAQAFENVDRRKADAPDLADPASKWTSSIYGGVATRNFDRAIRTMEVRQMDAPDGVAQLKGNWQDGVQAVQYGRGMTNDQKAMLRFAGAFTEAVRDDAVGVEAARQSAIESGATKPQSLSERIAHNLDTNMGGFGWRGSRAASVRMEQAMFRETANGVNDYLHGNKGNAVTGYLNDRYGPVKGGKGEQGLAMALWASTNPHSAQSGWSPDIDSIQDFISGHGADYTDANRGVAANVHARSLRRDIQPHALYGGAKVLEALANNDLGAQAPQFQKNVYMQTVGRGLSPGIIGAAAAIHQWSPDRSELSDLGFVQEVASVATANNPKPRPEDFQAAYQTVRSDHGARNAVSGGTAPSAQVSMQASGGAPTSGVNTSFTSDPPPASSYGAPIEQTAYVNYGETASGAPIQSVDMAGVASMAPMGGQAPQQNANVRIVGTRGAGASAINLVQALNLNAPPPRSGNPNVRFSGDMGGGSSGMQSQDMIVNAYVNQQGGHQDFGRDAGNIAQGGMSQRGFYIKESTPQLQIKMQNARIPQQTLSNQQNMNVLYTVMNESARTNGGMVDENLIKAASVVANTMPQEAFTVDNIVTAQLMMESNYNGNNISAPEIATARDIIEHMPAGANMDQARYVVRSENIREIMSRPDYVPDIGGGGSGYATRVIAMAAYNGGGQSSAPRQDAIQAASARLYEQFNSATYRSRGGGGGGRGGGGNGGGNYYSSPNRGQPSFREGGSSDSADQDSYFY